MGLSAEREGVSASHSFQFERKHGAFLRVRLDATPDTNRDRLHLASHPLTYEILAAPRTPNRSASAVLGGSGGNWVFQTRLKNSMAVMWRKKIFEEGGTALTFELSTTRNRNKQTACLLYTKHEMQLLYRLPAPSLRVAKHSIVGGFLHCKRTVRKLWLRPATAARHTRQVSRTHF